MKRRRLHLLIAQNTIIARCCGRSSEIHVVPWWTAQSKHQGMLCTVSTLVTPIDCRCACAGDYLCEDGQASTALSGLRLRLQKCHHHAASRITGAWSTVRKEASEMATCTLIKDVCQHRGTTWHFESICILCCFRECTCYLLLSTDLARVE